MIVIQSEPLDTQAAQARLMANPQAGAVVSFHGLMRDHNDGQAVSQLTLEHYPGMTEKALAAIIAEAQNRWALYAVEVQHRVGPMQPSDIIVYVGVSSAHRQEAFAACDFIMDYLKTRAPFWKKEVAPSGSSWLDGRESDQDALRRWQD
ncbi:molybdopterin synthase catalytic subunit MoaE [Atopomonas sediminilitoris]|uniref:molybdopterin synthase catalytic subunit MoaE n=1 Tax=Atopomonas sediminilitoris TaxID=2919919 RepID=UPI002342E0C8|nr:molybdopterin synthase catalytic subunit MoaE [Atopomonas sediminilitoris]